MGGVGSGGRSGHRPGEHGRPDTDRANTDRANTDRANTDRANTGRYTRYWQTSGTSTAPIRWLDTPESQEWMLGCWEYMFGAMGITRARRPARGRTCP